LRLGLGLDEMRRLGAELNHILQANHIKRVSELASELASELRC